MASCSPHISTKTGTKGEYTDPDIYILAGILFFLLVRFAADKGVLNRKFTIRTISGTSSAIRVPAKLFDEAVRIAQLKAERHSITKGLPPIIDEVVSEVFSEPVSSNSVPIFEKKLAVKALAEAYGYNSYLNAITNSGDTLKKASKLAYNYMITSSNNIPDRNPDMLLKKLGISVFSGSSILIYPSVLRKRRSLLLCNSSGAKFFSYLATSLDRRWNGMLLEICAGRLKVIP
jgi:hypothetical protein